MKNFIIHRYPNIQFLVLSGLMLFPLTPRLVESILMILFMLFALLYFIFKGRNEWDKQSTKNLLITGAVFILLAISFLYSENYNSALSYIQTFAPIIVFPFAFLASKEVLCKPKKLELLLTLYVVSLTLILIILNIYSFQSLYINQIDSWHLRQELEAFTDVHGTYLAMWIGFGILILVHKIKDLSKYSLIIAALVGVYFIYWMLVLGARMPLFATSAAILVFLLMRLKWSFKKITLLLLAVSIAFFTLFYDTVIIKLNDMLDYKSAFPAGKYEVHYGEISNEDIRSGIYYCSIKTLGINALLGVGLGDVDDNLQLCYTESFSHTDIFTEKNYNSHSQYLFIVLAIGIIGFALFLISLFYLFKVSLTQTSPLYFCFLIVVLLCFSFENILSRHDGVIFFSLINSLLFFGSKKKAFVRKVY